MMFLNRRPFKAVAITLAVLAIAPLLVPLPPLADSAPPEQLADPDSRFTEVGGLRVHYKTAGQGEPALVLLHGFGASLFSWREVMGPLAEKGTVVAFDRPAFGLTSRPMPGEWQGENPYGPEAQVELTVGLLDKLGTERAVLVGHSAGGAVAAAVALRYPERVRALVLVDPALYHGGSPSLLQPLLGTPQLSRLGPLFLRYLMPARGDELIRLAWHDPSKVTSAVLAGYHKPLQAQNWDRALWEMTAASRATDLPQRLGEIDVPVLVMTGDDDRIVPPAESARAAQDLPKARLVVIPQCGHLPQEERPAEFLRIVNEFLAEIS
ncbi:MAG: alpha/beta fold hydrolase [Chloroflexota bacterium]